MSMPRDLGDHDCGPAPRRLAFGWLLERHRHAHAIWARLIQPGTAEILTILTQILFEGLQRALTVGAMVIGHD